MTKSRAFAMLLTLCLGVGVAKGAEFTLWLDCTPPSNNAFGDFVSFLGDVNSDGYGDFLADGIYQQPTRVYFGGPAADSVADLAWTGNSNGPYTGPIDFNDDGANDVVFLSFDLLVHYGGVGIDTTPDLVSTPAASYSGYEMAAFDFNDDGVDDIIAGCHRSGVERVHFFYGSSTPDLTRDLEITTPGASGDNFARSLDRAGDVNGDGVDDLVVGAKWNDQSGTNSGRAYLYLGGASPSTTPYLTIVGPHADADLGTEVAGVGDVNGDGFDDWAVYYRDGTTTGYVQLYFGSATPDATVDVIFSAPLTSFGREVTGLGDLNADGFDDFAIADYGYQSIGAVSIYYGSSTVSTTPVHELLGSGLGGFGYSLAGGYDIDGDGLPEVLVGEPEWGQGSGRAVLFRFAEAVFTNETDNSNLEYEGVPYSSVSIDYNTDGNADLVLSIEGEVGRLFRWDDENATTGAAVFSDRSTIDFEVGSSQEDDQRGLAVADYDNDGDFEFFAAHATHPQFQVYNQATQKFENLISELGTDGSGNSWADDSWSGSWGDYDRDGSIDLLVGRATGNDDPATVGVVAPVLLRNPRGEMGTAFEVVLLPATTDAGITVSWADVDNDGEIDAMIGDLSGSSNASLFLNDGDGTFTDETTARIGAVQSVSGITWADLNRDGWVDLVIGRRTTSSRNVMLCENDGTGVFVERSTNWGIDDFQATNALSSIDYDLNGGVDLMAQPAAGSTELVRMYRNASNGGAPAYSDVASKIGISGGAVSGATVVDLDGDGDEDVYLGRASPTGGSGLVYYHNRPEGERLASCDDPTLNSLRVRLVGSDGNNKAGIGSRIEVLDGAELLQTQFVSGGSGRGGQESLIRTFGLGTLSIDLTVRVTWPDGHVETREVVVAEQTSIVVIEDQHGIDISKKPIVTYVPVPGSKMNWTIVWETDLSAPGYRDIMHIQQQGGPCDTFSDTVYATDSNVAVSVVPKAGGGYLHTMSITNIACHGPCTFYFSPESAVEVEVSGQKQVNKDVGPSKRIIIPFCIQ